MDSVESFLSEGDLMAMIMHWGAQIIIALLIFIIGKWIARRITNVLRKMMDSRDVDPTLISFLGNLVYSILLAAVALAALDQLGVPVTSLVAILGAAGLAIGLALKDSLGNFASGVMLVLFRPFSKGDFVEVAGVAGTVNEIRIFSTILTTPDNKVIIIPNGQVGAGTITNYSANDQRRVDLVFGVGYDDDLKVAKEVLTRICAEHPLVLDEPKTVVALANLGDSTVDFNVRPWVATSDYWTVYSDILERGKHELEAAGCNIPYPQSDIHLQVANPISDMLKG